MKTKIVLFISIVLIAVLAITVASQINGSEKDEKKEKYKITNITNKITVEEKQDCITTYYNETVNVYGNVTKTRDTYGTCFNPANQSYHQCVNGTEQYKNYEVVSQLTQQKSKDDCESRNSFVVEVKRNNEVIKKEVDFSKFGTCIQQVEGNCLAILCGTLEGGSARNGIFDGCDGGKYCQKFLFCENKIKVLYKGFRESFEEQDPSFHLPKGELKEVGE